MADETAQAEPSSLDSVFTSAKGPDTPGVSSESEVLADTKVESDEKPSGGKDSTQTYPEDTPKVAETKPRGEPSPKPAKKEATPKQGPVEKEEVSDTPEEKTSPWESDDNPYRKRYRDASAYANREHQAALQTQGQLSELNHKVTVLQKMADGTYDPEKDNALPQPSAEDIAVTAMNAGKSAASRAAAYKEYGEETTNVRLEEFHQLFSDNPMIQAMVLQHESPVYRALSILDKFHFEKKYGSDPKAIYAGIKKEVLAEAEKEMRARITEEIKAGFNKRKSTPTGLSFARGSNGLEGNANKSHTQRPLEDLFGR